MAASAALFVEGVYLLCFSGASYRKNINRRLKLLKDQTDRESILVQLRRERGLTSGGDYRLRIGQLQPAGAAVGPDRRASRKLVLFVVRRQRRWRSCGAAGLRGSIAAGAACRAGLRPACCRILVLRFLRGRRQKTFGAQFPDALDIIVRSLRAGHPVPIAISMVAREMPDPIGSEFGIVADEITYGADLETAMRNLYFRVGQDDLPLFVTAVAIQGIDRRQSRRDPGESVGRHPPALQDAPQDPRARRRRPRLGA